MTPIPLRHFSGLAGLGLDERVAEVLQGRLEADGIRDLRAHLGEV